MQDFKHLKNRDLSNKRKRFLVLQGEQVYSIRGQREKILLILLHVKKREYLLKL